MDKKVNLAEATLADLEERLSAVVDLIDQLI